MWHQRNILDKGKQQCKGPEARVYLPHGAQGSGAGWGPGSWRGGWREGLWEDIRSEPWRGPPCAGSAGCREDVASTLSEMGHLRGVCTGSTRSGLDFNGATQAARLQVA